jgi:protein-S-isoprenylcysteine O-methyltransferase Ste14
MTDSASTPRLRATFAIYLALIAAAAIVGPSQMTPAIFHAAGVVGFLLVAFACLGRIWCSVFIAGHKDETLVAHGPFAKARHPLYAFSLVGALGLGITSRSLLLCAIVVVLIAALVIYAAACEEQFLADTFPEQYQAYVTTVPRKWWPSFAHVPLPARLDVRPAVYWKAFLDAASFFVLYLLVHLAAAFRVGAFQ